MSVHFKLGLWIKKKQTYITMSSIYLIQLAWEYWIIQQPVNYSIFKYGTSPVFRSPLELTVYF